MNPFDLDFLGSCRIITEKYDRQKGISQISEKMLHIVSEIAELEKEMTRSGKWEDIVEEWADIILTTISLANSMGISNKEINEGLSNKLIKVKRRVENLK